MLKEASRIGSSFAAASPLLSLAIDCFGKVPVGEVALPVVRGVLITHAGLIGCFPSPMSGSSRLLIMAVAAFRMRSLRTSSGSLFQSL